MAARAFAGLALCAGAGGLELGLRLALGDAYRTVGYVERDAFPAAVLVARMEDQALDRAPVWDDVETFDGRPWRGRVDLVSAGFPCQPFSAAGQSRGVDDERWLWPEIARVVEEVAPPLVFAENVPPLATRGLDRVLRDLADLGFDVEWSCLSAAAVGGTHRRDRLWLLAHRDRSRLPVIRREPGSNEAARDDVDRPSGPAVADARRSGLREEPRGSAGRQAAHGRRPPDAGHEPERVGQDVAHAEGVAERAGLREGDPLAQARWLQVAESPDAGGGLADAAGPRWQGRVHRPPPGRPRPAGPGDGLPLWPPGPDDRAAWQQVLDADGPQPSVRRVADGLAHRVDRLHTIGNGVVPLVAAYAFLGLARRAGLIEGDLT